jgi:hypothetical protein
LVYHILSHVITHKWNTLLNYYFHNVKIYIHTSWFHYYISVIKWSLSLLLLRLLLLVKLITIYIYNYIYIHMYLNPWFLTHRPFPSSPVRSRRPNANLLVAPTLLSNLDGRRGVDRVHQWILTEWDVIQLGYCIKIHCKRIWKAWIQGGLHIFSYIKHIVL